MEKIQTIKMIQIAQETGVAASTVSRALRSDPRIGVETREKIQAAAARLGYRPNPLVSALMATRRRRGGEGEVDIIALVTDYGSTEDWRGKDVCRWEYEGICRRAAELGFRVEVFPLGRHAGDAARLGTTLRARGIRGVLLGFSREREATAPFPTEGFAVAGLSSYFRTTRVDRANFHGFYNVHLALEEMWRLGYRRPALLVPELNNRISNNQWSGAFLDWQRPLPLENRCELFTPTDDLENGVFEDWFARNRPDALLVYKVPVRRFLENLGLRVPQDIGLAYLYRSQREMAGTAGIDGNLAIVGAAALDLVVEKLNANQMRMSEHPKEVLIQGTWLAGETLPARSVA